MSDADEKNSNTHSQIMRENIEFEQHIHSESINNYENSKNILTLNDDKKIISQKKRKQKRKGRFITPMIFIGLVIAIILGCLLNIYYCKNNFEVNFYEVESVRVSSEIRIVVISDVHLSEYGNKNDDLVNETQALHPDLIISAGDLVTYGNENYQNMLDLCSRMSKIAPLYGIMGNHEDEKVYLEHDNDLRDRFASSGMNLLINTCEKIKIKNNDIELVGVSGGTEGFDKYGGKDTMEKLDKNTNDFRICCAHVPTLFTDRLEKYDFDIGIAGHTHGGLIRLPVVGGLYTGEEGFLPNFDGGIFKLKNKADLIVSRGLGTSGKIPRFNNTPELVVIDVKWY